MNKKKIIFLIIGIVLGVLGIISLLYSGLLWMVYKNALDGSPEFYGERLKLAVTFLITGVIAVLAGVAAIIFSRKSH